MTLQENCKEECRERLGWGTSTSASAKAATSAFGSIRDHRSCRPCTTARDVRWASVHSRWCLGGQRGQARAHRGAAGRRSSMGTRSSNQSTERILVRRECSWIALQDVEIERQDRSPRAGRRHRSTARRRRRRATTDATHEGAESAGSMRPAQLKGERPAATVRDTRRHAKSCRLTRTVASLPGYRSGGDETPELSAESRKAGERTRPREQRRQQRGRTLRRYSLHSRNTRARGFGIPPYGRGRDTSAAGSRGTYGAVVGLGRS